MRLLRVRRVERGIQKTTDGESTRTSVLRFFIRARRACASHCARREMLAGAAPPEFAARMFPLIHFSGLEPGIRLDSEGKLASAAVGT